MAPDLMRVNVKKDNILDLIDSNLKDNGVKPIDMSSQFFFDVKMPEDLIASMLAESLVLLEDPASIDWDTKLAGRIDTGRQVMIDMSEAHQSFHQFKEVVENLGHVYVERFFAKVYGNGREFRGSVDLNSIWIVDQRENDYNPLHGHNNKSPAGLSGVVYLKAPEFLYRDEIVNRQANTSSKERSSAPGWLNLFFGQVRVKPDMNNFVTTGGNTIAPIPGRCVLFPQSQPHWVYPFSEPGQRICIAFNLNVWYKQPGITAWSDLLLGVEDVQGS